MPILQTTPGVRWATIYEHNTDLSTLNMFTSIVVKISGCTFLTQCTRKELFEICYAIPVAHFMFEREGKSENSTFGNFNTIHVIYS